MEERKCGSLELWSVYRSNLRLYSNVILSLLYSPRVPIDLDQFEDQVRNAVYQHVIPLHPLLDCDIINASSNEPSFIRRNKKMEDLPITRQHVDSLVPFFQAQHDEWQGNEHLWRLIISPATHSNTAQGKTGFWVTLVFHHAIGDGTSGLLFHHALLTALSAPHQTERLPFLSLPPALESTGLNLRVSWRSLLGKAMEMYLPAWLKTSTETYVGDDTTMDQRKSSKTGLLRFVVPTSQVSKLRARATALKISIHALLHGSLLHCFPASCTSLPITTKTPINLRPILPPAFRSQMATYISSFSSSFAARASVDESSVTYCRQLHDAKAVRQRSEAVGFLSYLPNAPATTTQRCGLEQRLLDMLHVRRLGPPPESDSLERQSDTSLTATFEISNLGNWIPPESKTIAVCDSHFSGSNGPLGELYNVCVMTVHSGEMSVACTYRTGFVSDQEAQRVMNQLEEIIMSF